MPDTSPAAIAALDRFAFGDSPDLADSLLALVLARAKTATCWSTRDGQQTAIGKRMVACDGRGRASAVLETVALDKRRFAEVDDAFARKEGEGDLSLAWWRDAHERYFTRNGGFAPEMLLWCEEFVLVADLTKISP